MLIGERAYNLRRSENVTMLEANHKRFEHATDERSFREAKEDWLDVQLKLEQLTYTQEQRELLVHQITYTRTIKWATIVMTGATIIMGIATCVLAFK